MSQRDKQTVIEYKPVRLKMDIIEFQIIALILKKIDKDLYQTFLNSTLRPTKQK